MLTQVIISSDVWLQAAHFGTACVLGLLNSAPTPVFELPGGCGVEARQLFSQLPLTHCQIMFWGVSYILYRHLHRIYIIIFVALRQSKNLTPN